MYFNSATENSSKINEIDGHHNIIGGFLYNSQQINKSFFYINIKKNWSVCLKELIGTHV